MPRRNIDCRVHPSMFKDGASPALSGKRLDGIVRSNLRWRSRLSAISRLAPIAFGLAVAVLAPSQASADTFTAAAFENSFGIGPCSGGGTNTSSSPVSVLLTCGSIGGTIVASAGSSPGHVGASLQVNGNGFTFSIATFQTLVTITPPAGFTGTSIPIALNLAIAGAAGTGGTGFEAWNAMAAIEDTQFNYGTTINGTGITAGSRDMHFTSGTGDTFPGPGSELVSGILTTPFVTVGVNVPVNIQFQIELDGSFTVVDLFGNSLDFPTGSDVFVLPAGFTAEDPDSFIVDNRFVPSGATVPEPSSWVLLVTGMLGLLAVCRQNL